MRSLAHLVDRKVLAIDWDRESIRIMHAKTGKKGPRRIRAFLVPIPEVVDVDDPESLGHFIAAALKQRRIHTRRAIMAIPREKAVLNTLTLPKVPIEEMPSVVHFQITKELPFAMEEAKIDFASFPAGPETENVDVLVAAVRNDELDHYKSVCQNARLELERIGLRPYANNVAVTYGRDIERIGCMLMMDIGPVLTEINLIRKGHLTFSRAASVNVPVMPRAHDKTNDLRGPAPVHIAPTDAEVQEAVNNLLLEVTRTIEAYRVSNPGAEIDQIVVAGSCGIEETLRHEAAQRFGAPAKLYNPGEMFDSLKDRSGQLTAFGASMGLIIGHGAEGVLHFDFLHPKEPTKVVSAKVRKIPVVAATVLVFALAALVFQTQKSSENKRKLDELKPLIKKRTDEQKALKAFGADIDQALSWRNREVVWLDQLAVITELFPNAQDAYVAKLDGATKAEPKEEKTIEVELRARHMGRLIELRKTLEDKGPFVANAKQMREANDKAGYIAAGKVTLTLKPSSVPQTQPSQTKGGK